MIIIEKTSIIGRYNLINTEKSNSDDSRYMRQLSTAEVQILAKSIIDLIKE
jgi:hypothetical protein